jgi:hypothetical protein
MHSPKFKAKARTLAGTINTSSLRNSWKKKVRDDVRKQIIPDPVEHLDFHVVADAACEALATEITSGSYLPNQVTRVTTEKSKGLCRLIVIPNIRDVLVLQVLADSLWSVLKSKAPTKNAFYAPKDHAFLKMRHGLEDEYGPVSEWLKFQKEILGFATRKKFIVVTDIANYYDWIRYAGLRNVLADLVEAREVVLDLLLFVLGSMVWKPDYMPNFEMGLPQCDFDAPRLLAHAFLFETDELLRDYPDVEFARYADDVDIGCDTYTAAKRVLRDLDLTLQSRHLRLNSGKTQILTAPQAIDHFCVEQNALLTKFEKKMEGALKRGQSSQLAIRLLPWLTTKWFGSGRFEKGNGLKLLKRIVGYSRQYAVEIDDEFFLYAFLNWPSLREPLLRYVSHATDPFKYVGRLAEAMESGQIVDTITPIRIAVAVTSARFTRRFPPGCLDRLLSQLNTDEPFQVFARIWLLSRFSDDTALKRMIDNTRHIWSREPILIRGVAGMLPLLRGTKHLTSFEAALTRSGGQSASAILDFYETRIFSKKGFQGVSKFIGAKNKASINGITHAKFLMLYGYLSSPDFTRAEKGKFLLKHVQARRDLYYRFLIDQKLKSLP